MINLIRLSFARWLSKNRFISNPIVTNDPFEDPLNNNLIIKILGDCLGITGKKKCFYSTNKTDYYLEGVL